MVTNLIPQRRSYYSVRADKRPAGEGFSLADFKRFFLNAYDRLDEEGLFQEWFGYVCVDAGDVNGKAGSDLDLFVFRKLRTQGLWPIRGSLEKYSEDDLFDMIELLHDHASKGVEGDYHQFNQCGWHYTKFDGPAGREIFRRELNDILADYGPGYEISAAGEIMFKADDAFSPLLAAELPHVDPENVQMRVASANLKFRRRSVSDRRDAVRELADVLEFIREDARTVLTSKDQSDLFNLANNFGIRHHTKDQKTDYDQAIWLSWMFYHYLATIHACVRMIEKSKKAQSK